MSPLDRRTFLKGAAAGVGMAVTGRVAAASDFVNVALPVGPPPDRKVDHLVVLMMENRSVDHYLGWYGEETKGRPGRTGFNAFNNKEYPDLRTADATDTVRTEHWGTGSEREEFAGCRFQDPSHSWKTRDRVFGHRNPDDEVVGWLDPRTGNDDYCLSYYEARDIPVTAYLVRRFAAFDHWHASLMGPTYPNRLYLHSAQSGGLKGNFFPFEVEDSPLGDGHGHPEWRTGYTWPTIWDVLDGAGVLWRYYYSNLPTIGLFGADGIARSGHISEFYADALAGALPPVTFIDAYTVEPQGLANDDHPHADIRLGQQFLADVVRSLALSPAWSSTALVITYDEWGGFWDHVTPGRIVGEPRARDDLEDDFSLLGWRVPGIVVSPWVDEGTVDHTVVDHTSVLRFIYENWGIPPSAQLHNVPSPVAIDNVDGRPGARVALPSIGSVLTRESPLLEVDIDTLTYVAPPEARIRCEVREGTQQVVADLFRAQPWLEDMGWRTQFPFADSFASALADEPVSG